MMLPYKGADTQRRRWLVGGTIIALLGAALCWFPLGDSLAQLSFDLPFVFRGPIACTNVVVVLEDRPTLDALTNQGPFPPPRTVHAQLIDRLREEGAKVIAFDIFFRYAKTNEDVGLAAAIKRHGNVVLGGVLETSSQVNSGQPGTAIVENKLPPDILLTNASAIGLLLVGNVDPSFGVRVLHTRSHNKPTLATAAARQAGIDPGASTEWINYYGPSPSLDRMTLGQVLQLDERKLPPNFLRGKIVFVGFDPSVRPASGQQDIYATPFTRFGHDFAPGVEIQANACANLINGDSLKRMRSGTQIMLALLFGAGTVVLIVLAGRAWAWVVVIGVFLGLTLASLLVQWKLHIWWNWLVPAIIQLPLITLLTILCPRLPRIAFISYRRKGGSELALAVLHWLWARGYDAFMDVQDTSKGEWLPQLRTGIESAPNFILILTPGAFGQPGETTPPENVGPSPKVVSSQKANSEPDWMLEEIKYALLKRKPIIPICHEKFVLSEPAPEHFREIPKNQTIVYHPDNPAATFNTLEKYLAK